MIAQAVKVTHIADNVLSLAIGTKVMPQGLFVVRMLLEAWRNMPHGLHFDQLVVSAEEAKKLQEHAAYCEQLGEASRWAWSGPNFVSYGKYRYFISKIKAGHGSGTTLKLLAPRQKDRYALFQNGSFRLLKKLAAEQIVSIVDTHSPEPANVYQITFRDAAFFDFLRVGMAWRHHSFATLCPVCFCIESLKEIEEKHDFVTKRQDARNLSGTSVSTKLYQCRICDAKWEQTRYTWHTDFSY